MGEVRFPLLSDWWPHGKIATEYGVLREDGRSERAIFLLDKDGIIRYIDIHDIDEQPSNQVLLNEIREMDPEAARLAPDFPEEDTDPPTEGMVLYCSSWCPACRRARAWLKARDIEYTEIDVYSSKKAAEQVREWADGNLTTPTFSFKGNTVVDWKPDELERLLG